MQKLFYFLILSLLVLTGCRKEEEAIEWEYKVYSFGDGSWEHLRHLITQETKMEDFFPTQFQDPTDILNVLGEDGWELVDVYTTTETVYPNMGKSEYHTGVKENTRTQTVNFVFKRKKTKDTEADKETSTSSKSSNVVDVTETDADSVPPELVYDTI